MRRSFAQFALLTAFALIASTGYSQSTFSTVRSLMQAKCATSGCHDGSVVGAFNATVSANDLYSALVNVAPENTVAEQKGNKLVDAGHPYNSFLLRKVAGVDFDAFMTLDAGESDSKHEYNSTTPLLEKYEIELIRQWIIEGAPESGTPVNYQQLQDYYNNGGTAFIPVPEAPPAVKGIQLRMGPIFLDPNEEIEVIKKERVRNNSVLKVAGMDGYMTSRSHHLLLFKFDDDGRSEREGTRTVPFEGQPFNNGTLTGAWQDDGQMELPKGTAFIWQSDLVLDFDYHITNKGNSQILPADFYLNVYYYEDQKPPIEMHAELVNVVALVLFEGQNTRTRTHEPGSGDRYIWLMTSHTHKFGTDYDIYLRNSDGSQGEQIYEGFYDVDYTFNQGFYDWEHPPIRTFEPLKKFNGNDGLIYETKWNVVGQPLVTFGLTTNEEMQLFTYMYTKEEVPTTPTTGVGDDLSVNNSMTVYPNPFQNSTSIRYSIEKASDVKMEVFDVLGKKVTTVLDESLAAGEHSTRIGTENLKVSGVYFVTLTVDGQVVGTRKITML